jgi:hypothetical protein
MVWLSGYVICPLGACHVSPDLAAYYMHEDALSQIRYVLAEQHYVAIIAPGSEYLTVRAERDAVDLAAVGQGGTAPAGRQIPQADVAEELFWVSCSCRSGAGRPWRTLSWR